MYEHLLRPLRRDLPGHAVFTVQDMGWRSAKNGVLLSLADAEFDALVTADQNMRYQQNLTRLLRLAIVVLVAPDIRLETLRPLMPQVLAALPTLQPGTLTGIGSARRAR